jgi:hypothetical protein
MDLKKAAVWEEFYFGLKANGWSKEEAAKAAHRHVRQMSRRKINDEVTRILMAKEAREGDNWPDAIFTPNGSTTDH